MTRERCLAAWIGIAVAAMPAAARAADMPGEGAAVGVEQGYGAGLDAWRRRAASACTPWQPPYSVWMVPTNAPCDPTYVGSSMGLSRPSYYGTLPPPGYDAP